MIIFDNYGHLVRTESAEELHAFAACINLHRSWYQAGKGEHPHYDLTSDNARDRARAAGAIQTTPQDLVRRAWWAHGRQGA